MESQISEILEGIGRTAFCTGVHAIIIPDKGVGALNEDAILTSAGALEKFLYAGSIV